MFYKRKYYKFEDESNETLIEELEEFQSITIEKYYKLDDSSEEVLSIVKLFINGYKFTEFENDNNEEFILKIVSLFKKYLEYAISNDNKILDLNMLLDKCTAIALSEDEEDD